VVAAYDFGDVATDYDRRVQEGHLIHPIILPGLLELVGPVAGLRVCDLACGNGIVARELARLGALHVVGVDISENLLTIARRYEDAYPLGVEYRCDNAHTLETFEDDSLDVVTCNLALTDIPELDAMAQAVARVLGPGGAFIFSLPHPCFHAPGSDSQYVPEHGRTVARVGGYFVEGYWQSPRQYSGMLGGYHRMLSTIQNTLTDCGLWQERAWEPQARVAGKPAYWEVPVAWVARHRKDEGGRTRP
jgi:SAM-dependent methyltransferase